LPSARLLTMQRMIANDATADEFVSPGSVFPLRANAAGVMGRRGQTEGSYDLSRICQKFSSGVICEILADDGTMLRGDDLRLFADRYDLLITSVEAVKPFSP
jgi:3,4-dihydroxy-2-butanone 4-phosphate synthase